MRRVLSEFRKFAPALSAVALMLLQASPSARPSMRAWTTVRAADAPPPAPEDFGTLAAGETASREISLGQAHSDRVSAAAGQYVRLSVEHRGARLGLAVRGAGSSVLFEQDCRQSGLTPVSLVAETDVSYVVELRAREGGAARGSYSVSVAEQRPSAPEDARRAEAERAFAEAERLRAEERAESSRRAAERFDAAASLYASARDRAGEAEAHRGVGDVRQELGESAQAFASYERALALSREAGDRRGEADALNALAFLHFFLGDMQRAFDHSTRALAVSREARHPAGEARALNTLGEAHYGFGDFPRSLAAQADSLAAWRALGDPRGQAQSLLSFGYAYAHLSEIDNAQQSFREALALWQQARSARGQAATLIALGNLLNNLGEKQEALDSYGRAGLLLAPVGDRSYEAYLQAHLARLYRDMGEHQPALEHNERALTLFHDTGNRWGEAEAQLEVGRVRHALGDDEEALRRFNLALEMFRSLPMPVLEAQTLRDIGLVHDSRGQARSALDFYDRALRLFRRLHDKRDEAYTLNYVGRVHARLGERRKASAHFERALSLSHGAGDRYCEAAALYNLADLDERNGRLAEARARMESALSLVESLRAKVARQDLRAAFLASVQQYYEKYTAVLMRLHGERPGAGFDAAAFEVSERARARSLLESLREARAEIRRGVAPELLERERALRRTLNAKAERLMRLLGERGAGEETAALEKEIERVTGDYENVMSQIRATSPRYAALTQPRPLGVAEVQRQLLDEGTLLLKYALGDERSYLWAVGKDDLKAFELPPRERIERAASALRQSLIPPRRERGEGEESYAARAAELEATYRREAAALARMLLADAAPLLGDKRLLVVPDGALQYIPFQLLPAPDAVRAKDGQANQTAVSAVPGGDDDAPLLLDRHEIVNLPSASTLALLRDERTRREPSTKGVAVLADPVFERDDPRLNEARSRRGEAAVSRPDEGTEHVALQRDWESLAGGRVPPRLYASGEEARAIMAVTPEGAGLLALGFEATKQKVLSAELRQYPVIHFATHGLLDSAHPELSSLVLSLYDERGQSREGFLRLHDIYNLDLPAELVVLSACNTGLGKDVRGEGLVGLTRAFMYAGAPRVMASLWKVEDEATAELMKDFYRRLMRDNLTPAAALRQAQLHLRRETRWRAPYYWAAFVVQGEYEGRIRIAGPPPVLTAARAAAALALALCAGSLYLFKRRRKKSREG